MKNLYLLFLFTIGITIGCEKVEVDEPNSSSGKKLQKITENGKPFISFEYSGNLLVKENNFAFCEENPADEFFYVYQDEELTASKAIIRSIYSSTVDICDPAKGVESEEVFEYDSQGRLSRIKRERTYIEYSYNPEGLVEALAMYDIESGEKFSETAFRYDSQKNIIEESDQKGNTTYYQYDDKINPFYYMNRRPAWVSAYNKSPNNVIKASGATTFERSFEYNAEGLPIRVVESNGLTYLYVYQ